MSIKVFPYQKITNTFDDVESELRFAYEKFPAINSASESFGIIYEEVMEYLAEVRSNKAGTAAVNNQFIEKELIQIAAMAIRSIVDLKEKTI